MSSRRNLTYERETCMRKTFALIVAVGLTTALVTVPSRALGKATSTDYTAIETQLAGPDFGPADWTKPVVQVDFESVFEDDATDPRASGITHVSGKLTIQDMATFAGTMHGTSVTVVTGNGYEGTWVGRWHGKLLGYGASTYSAVAHGTGDLAGMKLFVEYDSAAVPNMTGRILDPHGD